MQNKFASFFICCFEIYWPFYMLRREPFSMSVCVCYQVGHGTDDVSNALICYF